MTNNYLPSLIHSHLASLSLLASLFSLSSADFVLSRRNVVTARWLSSPSLNPRREHCSCKYCLTRTRDSFQHHHLCHKLWEEALLFALVIIIGQKTWHETWGWGEKKREKDEYLKRNEICLRRGSALLATIFSPLCQNKPSYCVQSGTESFNSQHVFHNKLLFKATYQDNGRFTNPCLVMPKGTI